MNGTHRTVRQAQPQRAVRREPGERPGETPAPRLVDRQRFAGRMGRGAPASEQRLGAELAPALELVREATGESLGELVASHGSREARGGPVGVDNLAAAIGEERDTIEDVLEPYLIQQGYIMRTPRGRVVTRHAYLHFGLNAPKRMDERPTLDLFNDGDAP